MNVNKKEYKKPMLFELSTAIETQGMGITMLLMRPKSVVGTENDFLLNPRHPS